MTNSKKLPSLKKMTVQKLTAIQLTKVSGGDKETTTGFTTLGERVYTSSTTRGTGGIQ